MIDKWLETNFQKIVEVRRWLHQHPEVGFNEHETTRYCQNLMGELELVFIVIMEVEMDQQLLSDVI